MIEEVRKIVAEDKDEIRKQFKAIFGSYARGDNHADSDLDLLVDMEHGADLFDLVGLQQFLEDRLGCKVDVVSKRALRKEIRATVLNKMISL